MSNNKSQTFQELLAKKKKSGTAYSVLEGVSIVNEELREGWDDLEVDLSLIDSFEGQCRSLFDEEKMKELEASIREIGVTSPVILLKENGEKKHKVISGERRVRACRSIGLSTIPARVCVDRVKA
ncbi:MAG: ParB N-terminal domain-containing protein [Oligoflexia bacterium]|nr:ParB N-terminal domain-containing protein [Oligoflexia bacterium]